MKRLRVSLLCLLLLPAFAQQASEKPSDLDFTSSGNAFLRLCEPASRGAPIYTACLSYVIGVVDGAETVSEERFHELLHCPSPDVENGQKYRIAVKYIKEHPERTNLQTRILIVDALTATFPCQPHK